MPHHEWYCWHFSQSASGCEQHTVVLSSSIRGSNISISFFTCFSTQSVVHERVALLLVQRVHVALHVTEPGWVVRHVHRC